MDKTKLSLIELKLRWHDFRLHDEVDGEVVESHLVEWDDDLNLEGPGLKGLVLQLIEFARSKL